MGYFSKDEVIHSMPHEHYYIWLEMLGQIERYLKPQMRIVDFGCSSGDFLRLLYGGFPDPFRSLCPSFSLGIDLPRILDNFVIVDKCQNSRDLPILLTSAGMEQFPSQVDLIFSHEVLYLVPDLRETLRGAFTALDKGGLFCASTMGHSGHPYFQRWQTLFKERHIRVFPRMLQEYRDELERAGFQDIEIRTLRLAPMTYRKWRKERPFDDREWFESAADEERYFTELGKPIFTARKPT